MLYNCFYLITINRKEEKNTSSSLPDSIASSHLSSSLLVPLSLPLLPFGIFFFAAAFGEGAVLIAAVFKPHVFNIFSRLSKLENNINYCTCAYHVCIYNLQKDS